MCGEFDGGVVVEHDVFVEAVDAVVVSSTQQHTVIEAVAAIVLPVVDVVDVGPCGGTVTSGVAAVLIAGDDGTPDGGGYRAGGSACVENNGAGGEYPGEDAVAQETLHGGGVQGHPALGATGEHGPGDVGGVDVDRNVGDRKSVV